MEYRTKQLNPDCEIDGITNTFSTILEFVIHSCALEAVGVDISNLIKQTEKFNEYYATRHSRSLSLLGHVYKNQGKKIIFKHGTGADLEIDDIDSELKVCQPFILKPKRKINTDLHEEIVLSISKMISSRFVGGAKQAKNIFFDLSDDVYFSTLDLFNNTFNKVEDPIENRLIFYSSRMYPEGEVGRVVKGKTVGKINLTYPNNFIFNSYFIDLDNSLWVVDFSKLFE
jgi:ribosomal protein S13